MSCCNRTKLNNFYRGDTVPLSLRIKQNGQFVDITGSTIILSLKLNTDDIGYALQKTAVLDEPLIGRASIILSPSDTNILPSEYYYDIEWTSSAGSVKTLLAGTLEVLQDITQ